MPEAIKSKLAEVRAVREAKEAPEELKARLKGDLEAAVNKGTQDLIAAKEQLKTPEAQKYISSQAKEISGYLAQIAGKGREIVFKHKSKAEIEAHHYDTITNLSNSLKSELESQKPKIEGYRKYEKEEKKVDEFVKEVKELDKLHQEYRKKDLENDKRKKEGKKIVPLDNLRMQFVEKGGSIVDPWGEGPTPSSPDAEINNLYQALYNDKYSDADSTFSLREGDIESLEKEQGRVEAERKMEAVKETTLKLEIEMQKYIPIAKSLAANWEKADEAKKKDCTSLEQALLQGYASARSLLNQIKADEAAGKIHYVATELKAVREPVDKNIKIIESYKIERQFRAKLNKNEGYNKYYEFGTDEKTGRRIIVPTKAITDFTKWEDETKRNALIVHMNGFLLGARDQVRAETEQAEVKALMGRGKKGIERIKEKLGKKSDKYFEALAKLQAGDREAAMALLNEYSAQKFTKEEKIIHADLMEEAQTLYQTLSYSEKYYSALSTLKSGDQKKGIVQFKAYVAEIEKLPTDQQKLHTVQLKSARESIQKIGLENLSRLNDLFADVRQLREAKRRLAGAHLHYSESMEDEYIGQEIAAIRKKLKKNPLTDVFAEIEAAKTRVKKKVEDKLKNVSYEYEASLVDEAGALFDAMNNPDAKVRKKALIEFAKKCRKERAYGMAKKYLEHALEEDYKRYAKKVDRSEIHKFMLQDQKILNWINSNARAQYNRMKTSGRTYNLTFEQVRQRLVERKLDEAYRTELRKQMTLNGDAGREYYLSAKGKGGEYLADFAIITSGSEGVVERAGEGKNEALILYNEYFKDAEYEWYNATTWGAEDWDDFEDGCIEFAFETAMTFGIGAGAGAAGKVVGKAVMKALIRRGLSRAAVVTIRKGGMTAFKAAVKSAVKRESKGLLKAYVMRQAASIAAEGAVMFTLGTIQSGMIDPKGTAAQFESAWSGPYGLGEAIAKAAMYRVVGGALAANSFILCRNFGSIEDKLLGDINLVSPFAPFTSYSVRTPPSCSALMVLTPAMSSAPSIPILPKSCIVAAFRALISPLPIFPPKLAPNFLPPAWNES